MTDGTESLQRTDPAAADLAGMPIARLLPRRQRRAVGPFVFMDRFGPVRFEGSAGLQVPPHPHIGLATVTFLLDGRLEHRDSLGSLATIRPGGVNWMTAGRGITHSERSPAAIAAGGGTLDGVQFWVALPRATEECEPRFEAREEAELPLVEVGSSRVRVLAGRGAGARAPVRVDSELCLLDVALARGARVELSKLVGDPDDELALYVLDGSLALEHREATVGRTAAESGPLFLPREVGAWTLVAESDARCLLFGGQPLDGPRHMRWNFVSSDRARLDAAEADWSAGRFPAVPNDPEARGSGS